MAMNRVLFAAALAAATPALAAPQEGRASSDPESVEQRTISEPTRAEVEAEMKRRLIALESDQKQVRDEAAVVLRHMGVELVGPHLGERLNSEQGETRRVVLRAEPAQRGDRRAGAQLIRALRRNHARHRPPGGRAPGHCSGAVGRDRPYRTIT